MMNMNGNIDCAADEASPVMDAAMLC